ncbi:MAG: AAA family ATPase [Patescibacteria group bacterium]
MYLRRLEIQGFKTFAQKTVLEFAPDASGRRGITSIVGPNGSGKSNIADAIRWVMGEQSMKLLRAKKSEDVIFSGTTNRARSGFAEVVMTIENDDRSDIDLSEIVIARRLYRDGQSEYEVNKQPARLQDVALLLAQCGIAQRSYSVIGQGMVDQVLVASPGERKEFFDEAFGLRQFQLKRQNALNKLDEARKNLGQTEAIIREIEPRLVTLDRQVKRLQDRERFEEELHQLERGYYGHGWREIQEGMRAARAKVDAARAEEEVRELEAKKLERELDDMEKAIPVGDGFRELRLALDAMNAERSQLRERQMRLETKRAVAAVRAEKPWAPLPLSKILEGIQQLNEDHDALDSALSKPKLDPEEIREIAKRLRQVSTDLLSKLQRPAPEPSQEPERDPEVEREMAELAEEMARVATRTADIQQKMDGWNREEEDKRKHVFEVQRRLTQKRQEAQGAERRASDAMIDLTRFETRRDGFLSDLRQHASRLEEELDDLAQTVRAAPIQTDAVSRIQRLRSQLEWIGGIDPSIVKEHDETKERHDFLSTQTEDLRDSIQGLEVVIAELDTTIKTRSETAFKKLDQEFSAFFKKIFGGGDAKLVEIQPEPEVDEEGRVVVEVPEDAGFSGIDIQVTPPGKRFKNIALLSGGERALTSIALICAIMATNPSPFVVLDEVDAALDESNSRKFAEIVSSLADKTQFVVVTHNRATMHEASVLYGVTMSDDGGSQILSVKLEEVGKLKGRE